MPYTNTKRKGVRIFNGVQPVGNRWAASVVANGRTVYYREFDKRIHAQLAYNRIAREYFPSYRTMT